MKAKPDRDNQIRHRARLLASAVMSIPSCRMFPDGKMQCLYCLGVDECYPKCWLRKCFKRVKSLQIALNQEKP
jgi:hypothetical protein